MKKFTLLTLLLARLAQAGELRAGAAAVVITPPNGTPMAGYFNYRASTGVLDQLYAKAVVLEQDDAKAAFVALDLIGTTKRLVTAARRLIAEQCAIPPERVMISATHTHSGPVLLRDSPMDDITGAKQPLALEFNDKLPALIARAVAEANAKLAPVRAFATIGREEHLSFNRRYLMKDGTVAWQVRLNPDIVRPAGPIDPDVGVLHLARAAKASEPLATFVNFAMHPTSVGGLKISADYPGTLYRRLAEYLGTNTVTLFANGCCGNINHVNPRWAGQRHGPQEAERIGTVLAAAVLKAWPDLQPLQTFAPRVRTKQVTLPRRKITNEQLTEARRIFELIGKQKLSTPVMAEAVCILDTNANKDKPLEAEVQVIAFSDDFAMVALPGEIFVELGLAIKKASPFKFTFIAELANGSIGYIPNRSAYPEGQYEVVSARCAAGSGEILLDQTLKLLNELRNP
ncbi:MAG: neutral/alkaline non-lysosomal ceramidase N-terminal domain-containing protein [Verrucomicrobiae bacterium]|nr:neutral/alkaline non-lysosomal ceramidase N-terminal domain-containing protein [Verrucomicrobiae bacterium]